jgi:DnaD/phage-associated family protein
MARYRIVQTDFWDIPMVLEEMSPEDKLFYVYLLTNSHTTQIGIYPITKKQIALYLGYSVETVTSVMDRFIHHYKLIRYNPETRELAIKNWGKYNLHKGGKPVMDCIVSELKKVEDTTLIRYISEGIQKGDIRDLYESYCEQEVVSEQNEDDTYADSEGEAFDETWEKRNENEKQQQSTNPNHLESENPIDQYSKPDDVKEIIEFWDDNGFGFSNVNGKQQLLSWLDDSRFLEPKQVILKAMNIACGNNKRKLNYVVGILKNWENESLLTVEEIDSYHENQKPVAKQRQSSETQSYGRDIPRDFVLDLTAGED